MADTIITNTPRSQDDSGSTGFVAAIIIVMVLVLVGLFLYQNSFFRANPESTTNVKVTLPDVVTPSPSPTPTPAPVVP